MDFDNSFEDKSPDTEDNDELESRLYAEIYYKNEENIEENTEAAIPKDSYLNIENSHPRQKEFPVRWNRYHESALPALNASNDNFRNRENSYRQRGRQFGNKQSFQANQRFAGPSNTAKNRGGQNQKGTVSNSLRNPKMHFNDTENTSDVITYDDLNPINFKTPANCASFNVNPYHKNHESDWRVEGSPNPFYKPLDDEVSSSSIVEDATRKSFPETGENSTNDSDIPDTALKTGTEVETDSRDLNESSDMPKTARQEEEVEKETPEAPKDANEKDFRNTNSEEEEESKYEVDSKEDKMMKVEARKEEVEERKNLSDTDESIFEVPVPPKPKPTVIQLQDSDEEIVPAKDRNEVLDDEELYRIMDDGKKNVKKKKRSSSREKELKKKKKKKKKRKERSEEIEVDEGEEVQVEKRRKKTVEVQENEEIEEVAPFHFNFGNTEKPRVEESCVLLDSGSSQDLVSNDLVLNCTILQRGASSLEEIKALQEKAAEKEASARVDMESQLSRSESLQNHVQDAVPEQNISSTSPSKSSKVNRKRQAGSPRKEDSSSKKSKLSPSSSSSVPTMIQTERIKSKREWADYFFKPMSKNMRDFYNNTNMQMDRTVEEIQRQMSRDPNRWAILDDDIRSSRIQRNVANMRCTICRQCGHVKAHCPKKKKCLCHICGKVGHASFRCSQRMCLTCGSKQSNFREVCEVCRHYQCTLCKSQGHLIENCPEHWRKYHQSVNTAEFLVPENPETVMKPAHLLSCCNCAKRGHDVSTCREYRWSKHYRTSMTVQNYTMGPVYYLDAVVSTYSNRVNPETITPPTTRRSRYENATTDNNLALAVPEGTRRNDAETEDLQPLPATVGNGTVILFEMGKILKVKKQILKTYEHVLSGTSKYDVCGIKEGRVAPIFLNNFINVLSFRVRIYSRNNDLHLSINIPELYYGPFFHMLSVWLRADEFDKGTFMEFSLPRDRNTLVRLLAAKFQDLVQDHGDPEDMLRRIDANREKLNQEKDPQAAQSLVQVIREDEYKLLLTLQTYRALPRCSSSIKYLYREFLRIQEFTIKRLHSRHYLTIARFYFAIFVPRVPVNVEKMILRYKDNREQGVPENITVEDIIRKKVDPNAKIPKNVEKKVSEKSPIKEPPKKVSQKSPTKEPPKKVKGKSQKKCLNYLALQQMCREQVLLSMHGTGKVFEKEDAVRERNFPKNAKPSDDDVEIVEEPPEVIEILDDEDEPEIANGDGESGGGGCQELTGAKKAKILAKAKRAVANARKFNLPHMFSAANEVQKKINDWTIRPMHVKQLNRLINAENLHMKQVGAVMHQLK